MMNARVSVALMAFAAMVGCTSFGTYYKTGTTMDRIAQDQNTCAIQAEHSVPPRIFIEREPVFGPPLKPGGHARILYWETNVIDLNASLRERVLRQCMITAGYQRVTIPYCTPEQIGETAFPPLAKTPVLDESICAVRRNGRRLLIDLDKPSK